MKKLVKITRILGQSSSVLYAALALMIPERSVEFLLFAILFHLWGRDK